MPLLECLLLFPVLGPLLAPCLSARRALQDAPPAPDQSRGNRLQQDALRRGLHHRPGPVLDLKLFAQAQRDHHLPFGRKPHRLWFLCHTLESPPLLWTSVHSSCPPRCSTPLFANKGASELISEALWIFR